MAIIEFLRSMPFIHIFLFDLRDCEFRDSGIKFLNFSIPEFGIRVSGDHSEGATPVPIPNTEVKPFSADGTAWVTVWESRTLPGLK